MTSSQATGAPGMTVRRRWLVKLEGGGLLVVDGDAELRELLRRQQVTFESQVYEISSGPRAVGDVLEIAQPPSPELESEPPIRQPRVRMETRSPDRVKLSEELAVLNRPLDDEVEYYDEGERSRAKPVLAAMLVIAALGGAGYRWLAQRHHADDHAAAAPSPEAEAGSATSGEPGEAAPEGDPPMPATAGEGPSAAPPAATSSPSSRLRKPYHEVLAEADRLLENGRSRRAEELYHEVLAARPGDAAALTGLAYVQLDRGRIPDAVSTFKQALGHDERYTPALFGLGEAYREQGRRDLAVQAFQAYLAREPAGRDAAAARRQIQQLSP
jgi:hypothetical protein